MANFTLNVAGLENRLRKALDIQTEKIFHGLELTLDSPVFSWGTTTYRKNGEIVSDSRNAIDTGNLRDSMFIEKTDDLKRSILFGAEYTEKVFEHADVDLVEFTLDRLK